MVAALTDSTCREASSAQRRYPQPKRSSQTSSHTDKRQRIAAAAHLLLPDGYEIYLPIGYTVREAKASTARVAGQIERFI